MTHKVEITAGGTGRDGHLIVDGTDLSNMTREVTVCVSVEHLTEIDVKLFSDITAVQAEGRVRYTHAGCPDCKGHDSP